MWFEITLWHGCILQSCCNIARTFFYKNTWGVLLLIFAEGSLSIHCRGFIAPRVWEIVVRKNLTVFKGCHYSRFYMMISSSFLKIESKKWNSDLCILISSCCELHHQLHTSYLNIRNLNSNIWVAKPQIIGCRGVRCSVLIRHRLIFFSPKLV